MIDKISKSINTNRPAKIPAGTIVGLKRKSADGKLKLIIEFPEPKAIKYDRKI